MTREQQDEIRRLRALGEGYKRIGAALNLSVNTIKSFCRRDGGEAEPMTEPMTKPMAEAMSEPVIEIVTESVTESARPNDDLRCPRCHAPIQRIDGRRARIFCSDACRIAYWRVQAMPSVKRICLGCGTPLLGNDRNRKYCSHECYIMDRFGGKVLRRKD